MITLLTGLPGHGKGVYGIDYIKTKAEKENRQVYYHGIPDLKLPWIQLDKPEDWFRCPPGSIIFLDECQKVFRPRGNGSAVPEHVSELETHRHKGLDLFLVTQHPMLIDGNVRRLVDKHMHIVRKFGMQRAVVHEFQNIQEQPHKSRVGSIRHDYTYNTKIYGLYKSAEVHTVKRSLPMRYIALFIIPFLVAGVVYLAYTMLKPHERAQAIEKQPLPGSPLVMTKNEPMASQMSFLEARVPRVEALPQTAPVYDELTRPKVAPYPAACVVMRGKCTCYTQQATKLNTDDMTCRQIVENGYFIDFQEPPSARQPPPQQAAISPSAMQTESPKGWTVAPAPVGGQEYPQGSPAVRIPSKSLREPSSPPDGLGV